MRLKSVLRAMVAAVMLSTAVCGVTSAANVTDAQREAAELKIEELKARLNLTPDQEAQLAPLMQERNAKLKALRDGSGGDTSRRARRAMLQKAKGIQDDFNKQVEPILDEEQMKEWQAIRAEMRSKAKERLRNR